MPENLNDVVERIKSNQRVYGFELELLAAYISDGGAKI